MYIHDIYNTTLTNNNEVKKGYVPECEVLEELTDVMAPYNYLVKEQAIPKESTFTVDEFRQELLYNLFNEYWGKWNA